MKNIDVSLTRNDLIEYAVSKRIEEFKVKKDLANKEYQDAQKVSNAKIDTLKKKAKEIQKTALDKFIQDNYKDTITIMEKNLGVTSQVVTNDSAEFNSRSSISELAYMFGLRDKEALVVFVDETSIGLNRGPGILIRDAWDGLSYKTYDYYYNGSPKQMQLISCLKSFIRIDSSTLELPELKVIQDEIKSIQEDMNKLYNVINDYQKQINDVRSQKDLIKNALIEQTLSQTEEGTALLGVLNNLDINGMKALK